jgi:type I restriction enzyme S subunit
LTWRLWNGCCHDHNHTRLDKAPNSARLPPAWDWVPLIEVAKLESGHTPSRKHPEYWGGEIQWLSLKDIQGLNGRYVYETADKPTILGIENSSARLLPAGTVALCRTASVGKVVILGREMATSQDFVDWVCGPRVSPEFLYWALSCSSAAFNIEKQGSTHKTIYMPTLERLSLLLPPLDAQHRIAAILDKADAIRRKRQEAIALTEQLLRSTFLEMFGDPVTNPKRWPNP